MRKLFRRYPSALRVIGKKNDQVKGVLVVVPFAI